jgi:hypothetical protein
MPSVAAAQIMSFDPLFVFEFVFDFDALRGRAAL